jgi:hypothetical protein
MSRPRSKSLPTPVSETALEKCGIFLDGTVLGLGSYGEVKLAIKGRTQLNRGEEVRDMDTHFALLICIFRASFTWVCIWCAATCVLGGARHQPSTECALRAFANVGKLPTIREPSR